MNIVKCLFVFLWCAVCSWLALWAANIVNYIFSLPISFIGIAFEHATGILGFIYVFITTGIAYLLAYFMLFAKVFNKDVFWDTPILGRICLSLVIIGIIFICDVRIHPNLPDFCMDAIRFLQIECNYYILGTVNWSDLDFSGENLSDMEYLVFDIAVSLPGLAVLIFGGLDD